jgi:hypothetical protein
MYFTEVIVHCADGPDKTHIIRTELPLSEHLKKGVPYAYASIDPESGNVNNYDLEKDEHSGGPIFINFEKIISEVAYEERLALFEKIRSRDQKHMDNALVFLLTA